MDRSLTLNDNELNLLLEALGMMPYAKIAGLINKVANQINEQNQPKQEDK